MVVAASERELFLGKTSCLADLPEHFAKAGFGGDGCRTPIRFLLHAHGNTATMQTIVTLTIVSTSVIRKGARPWNLARTGLVVAEGLADV